MVVHRNSFFDGIGTEMGKVTLSEAMEKGKLNYTVEKVPDYALINGEFKAVENQFHTIRTDTNQILDKKTVGKEYKIIQNADAFSFVDDLITEEVCIRSAGHYDENKPFILAKGKGLEILGDEVENYLFISTAHDGTASVSIKFLPIRFICGNGLIVFGKVAQSLRVTHGGDVQEKMKFVKQLIADNRNYLELVKEQCEELAQIYMNEDEFNALCEKLYPIPKDKALTEREMNSRQVQIDRLKKAYHEDDIANFSNTAYKAIMAVSDNESHGEPLRRRQKSYQEYQLRNALSGLQKLQFAYAIIKDQYGYRFK